MLWDDPAPDGRPLPLIVAAKWEFNLQHHVADGETWYALRDWVEGLTGEESRFVLAKLKRTMGDMLTSSRHMPYHLADGRHRKLAFVVDVDLYRVAAYLRPMADRPALAQIKEYLARAGAFADELRLEPERAAARIEGMVSRKAMMDALSKAVQGAPGWLYGAATNDVYKGLYKRSYGQLAADLRTKSPRDKMSVPALRYLDIAEWMISQQIGSSSHLTADQARAIIQDIAALIGVQVEEVEQRLRIDAVTGTVRPLIADHR